ncbi:hypothetical protein [Shewanella marina]|uniref:hypothetical protein n=1 Tax=Shewanella marina TaxID=487319 RepID=UPI000472E3DE|nr:hypothetical protein [Shewanella marina]
MTFKHCLFSAVLASLPITTLAAPQVSLDMGWDSKYVSQGRDNLDKGGIYWSTLAVEQGNLHGYATVGRGDSVHYTEWNYGLQYSLPQVYGFETVLGYQRNEIYGDERSHDNEFSAEISYQQLSWITPSINYTYATEADGYFIELALQHDWQVTSKLTISPYLHQSFDYGYVSAEHDGVNNLLIGVEAQYQLTSQLVLSAQINQSFAQQDIKQENADDPSAKLDQTFAGIHLTYQF